VEFAALCDGVAPWEEMGRVATRMRSFSGMMMVQNWG